MNFNTEKKREINCFFTKYSTNSASVSPSFQSCILHELVNESFTGQLPKRKIPLNRSQNILKNIIDEISFELKTPLANISLASELFETDLLSTEQKMFIDIIKRNSVRIIHLISNFNLVSSVL